MSVKFVLNFIRIVTHFHLSLIYSNVLFKMLFNKLLFLPELSIKEKKVQFIFALVIKVGRFRSVFEFKSEGFIMLVERLFRTYTFVTVLKGHIIFVAFL